MSVTPVQKKISSFNNIVIGANCQFTTGTIKTANGDVVTLPTSTSTVATVAQVTEQKERIDRLLDYLEAWIGVGNVNMDDIKDEVDPSS